MDIWALWQADREDIWIFEVLLAAHELHLVGTNCIYLLKFQHQLLECSSRIESAFSLFLNFFYLCVGKQILSF
jgi:hypothetical protein